jgi:hypothetical protein
VGCHAEHNGEDHNLIPWDDPREEFDHSLAGYTLTGRHAELDCRGCHKASHIPTSAADTITIDLERTYLGLSPECLTCHSGPHGDQLSLQCESCHTPNGFRPSTFTIAGHNQARFPLSGAHAAIICGECHRKRAPRNSKHLQFRFDSIACDGCHEHPHGEQMSEYVAQFLSSGSTEFCEVCHTTQAWSDLRQFDHSATSFQLEGAHSNLPCTQCHKRETIDPRPALVFKGTPNECRDCHGNREPADCDMACQFYSIRCVDGAQI